VKKEMEEERRKRGDEGARSNTCYHKKKKRCVKYGVCGCWYDGRLGTPPRPRGPHQNMMSLASSPSYLNVFSSL
jgi:hypothetical protein